MPPLGFEPTISADDPKQTYALDCAVDGIDNRCCRNVKKRKLIEANEKNR